MLKQASATRSRKRFTCKHAVAQVPEETYGKEPSDDFASSDDDKIEATPLCSSSLPAVSEQNIGREQELEALSTLLRSPEVRLVTLTGAGGIGKSHLALHTATYLRSMFVDGVNFVSLASIRHPEMVLPTLAQALRIEESNNQSLLEAVKRALQKKRLLLLIDTMEHVISATPYLTYLLESCPHLKMLVTSRRGLHLQGEQRFPVPPLTLPDLTALPEDEDLLQYEAVALFVEQTRAAYPGFRLTTSNARAIAEICVHLDGLPLALKMAAARMKLMSCKELLLRLRSSSTRLSILTNDMRDAPAHHQTQRQSIAWSYALLTAQEQRVFQTLSVFESAYPFRAIEGICPDNGEAAQGISLLDIVSSLIDQNVLQVRRDGEGEEPCFMMMETIRAYGQECLEQSGEEAAVRQIYTAYSLTLEQAMMAHDQKNVLCEETQKRKKEHVSSTSLSLPHGSLTAREIEVLCLVAQGLTSTQIAQQLMITPLTVNSHVRSIYSKLGISTRSAATRYAIEQNLL
ncbi:MAG TPA: LuxR C-terminal-related transcriptional regulator [Ktedonobacteraceae bacterium]|nr:LuxR C-terminal-related transcriptional regulator [Ktedonobacteraceae bacterium]